MPLTAIYLIPPSNTSPVPTLTSHITLSFPCKALPPFTLSHHLYASTSSLPSITATWPPQLYNRSLLSILTLSPPHNTPHPPPPPSTSPSPPSPSQTYLLTSTPNPIPSEYNTPGPQPVFHAPQYTPTMTDSDKRQARLTADDAYQSALSTWQSRCAELAPAATASMTYSVTGLRVSSPDAFVGMVNAKMQALWSLRSIERVEGWSVLIKDGWVLRVGEVKQNVLKTGNMGVNSSRGLLVEVTWVECQGTGDEVTADDESVLRAFLDKIFDGTGISLEGARIVMGYTAPEHKTDEQAKETKGADWKVAELYAELLRTRS